MGSFNQTCALSNLPVRYEDRVVMLFIGPAHAMKAGLAGASDPGFAWQIVGMPIRGVYNDYGSATDLAIRPPMKRITEVMLGKSIDDALDTQKERYPEIDLTGMFGKGPLHFVLVHEELYDRLTDRMTGRLGDHVSFDTEKVRLQEFVDHYRATRDERFGTAFTFNDARNGYMTWSEHTGRKWTELPEIYNFFRGTKSVHPLLSHTITNELGQLEVAGDNAGIQELLEECLRLSILAENVQLLRKHWSPQAGLGMQDEDYNLHSELATWTLAKSLNMANYDCDEETDEESDEITSPAC